MKVEIYQLPTLPSSLRTSSPTSGGPLAPSGLFFAIGKLQPLQAYIYIYMGHGQSPYVDESTMQTYQCGRFEDCPVM